MPEHQDITLDRVKRISELHKMGVDPSVFTACVERASDGETLGMLIGLVEDLVEDGWDFSRK